MVLPLEKYRIVVRQERHAIVGLVHPILHRLHSLAAIIDMVDDAGFVAETVEGPGILVRSLDSIAGIVHVVVEGFERAGIVRGVEVADMENNGAGILETADLAEPSSGRPSGRRNSSWRHHSRGHNA